MTLEAVLLPALESSVTLGANVVGSDKVAGIPRDKTVIAKKTSVLVHAPRCPKGCKRRRVLFSGVTKHGLTINHRGSFGLR